MNKITLLDWNYVTLPLSHYIIGITLHNWNDIILRDNTLTELHYIKGITLFKLITLHCQNYVTLLELLH